MVAVIYIASLFISYTDPFRIIELNIYDQLFEIRGNIDVHSSPIVIVDISEQADEEIPEKYPWPTWYYAKLIENLNKAGAKAIGIDVIFDKRDNYDPANDTVFANALEKYGNVVLAGKFDVQRTYKGGGTSTEERRLVEPLEVLREANPNPYGLVQVVKDRDDEIRRYLLSLEYRNETYYSLGLELLKVYNGWEKVLTRDMEEYFQFGTYTIPKYSSNTMNINYFGEPRRFPYHSFDTVIDDSTVLLKSEDPDFQWNLFSDPVDGLLHTDVFRGKIVLIGATMPELQDFHATPFAGQGSRPGVETHAHALQTVLSGQYIRHASLWVNLILLLIFTILAVTMTKYAGAIWGFALYFLEALIVIGLVMMEFLVFKYVIDFSGPMLAVTFGYLSTLSYDYFLEQREKRRIREMFSSYVSPQLVDRMIESGQQPQLGGDEVNITAFFSDIESFTVFSEHMEPESLVELINEYLTAMTDIITEEGGTLDKYIGDAIVAFFGAPFKQEDHAYRACLVSQLMQQRLEELRQHWKSQGDRLPKGVQHMRNRIGINTGKMIIGNMGSARRFNYTIMGDNVNLASRCESGAKNYGVYSMVTEATKKEAEKYSDRCVFRYLDRIVVVGRSEPVNIYEIAGLKEQMDEDEYRCIELFEKGIDAYLQQDWDRATELFDKSSELEWNKPDEIEFVTTNPSLVYLKRCRKMAADPPDKEWDGVYVMETK